MENNNEELIQARCSKDLKKKAIRLAKSKDMSLAQYVRLLIRRQK